MAAFVARHHMLAGVRRLGVAVSGGSDSVALLRLLVPLCRAAGVTPVALHFDHGLRGAASAADARFVARLARRMGVACRMGRAAAVAGFEDEDEGRSAIRQPATKNQERRTKNEKLVSPATQSLEMRARAARQIFFREAAQHERLDAIATGHTADDVAETLLLRLARGSGATGLSGLRPCHTVADVKYVRPVLECTHAELRAWLRRKRQTWREDASNRDERIPRNRLRHTVLPWLERQWSPSIRAMLAQSAAILREEDALLDELARKAMKELVEDDGRGRRTISQRRTKNEERRTFHSSSVLRFPPATLPLALQRRVIRLWLLEAGCAAAAGWNEVERIRADMREQAAWQVSLPGGVLVRAKGGRIELLSCSRKGRARPPDAPHDTALVERGVSAHCGGSSGADLPEDCTGLELCVPGVVTVAGVQVTARRAKGIVRTPGPVGALPSSCALDACALRGKKLLVRTRQPGDRIRPLGLDGSKTLQDLFVDAKVPVAMRDHLPLLVVDNEVVWVPGYRVAQNFAVRGPRSSSVRVDMKVIGR